MADAESPARRRSSAIIALSWSRSASIEKILNLNHEKPTSSFAESSLIASPILNDEGEPIWKVLVFDNLGRDVISSVLRVQDLRNFGITIHLYVTPMLPGVDVVGGGASRRELGPQGGRAIWWEPNI